ncbi:MAG: DUF177 domain-containing protein, partial [Chloroflexota bacterium]
MVDIMGDGSEDMVHGEVTLTRTDQSVLLRGRIRTDIEITCSRCLVLFRQPLSFEIEEEYFPTIDVVSGNPVAMSGEPGSFTIDEHHILDLGEAIRQYALMVIPIKTLCRPDCAGLCPVCGHNLNEGRCG